MPYVNKVSVFIRNIISKNSSLPLLKIYSTGILGRFGDIWVCFVFSVEALSILKCARAKMIFHTEQKKEADRLW